MQPKRNTRQINKLFIELNFISECVRVSHFPNLFMVDNLLAFLGETNWHIYSRRVMHSFY